MISWPMLIKELKCVGIPQCKLASESGCGKATARRLRDNGSTGPYCSVGNYLATKAIRFLSSEKCKEAGVDVFESKESDEEHF